MERNQAIFGILLVATLLGMAGLFIWRQWQTLRGLRSANDLSPEDRRYTRKQVWRRLLCSALMIVLAGLLATSFSLEAPIRELMVQGDAARDRAEPAPLDAHQQRVFNQFSTHWIITLLVLLAIISLAAVDFFAIRRYGQRHYRQIQADRRAMIENQLARLRSQRNGHG